MSTDRAGGSARRVSRVIAPWLQRMTGRPILARVAKNAGYFFADRAVRIAVGVFVGVWMARYLGPHDFGLYSFAIAFCYLFVPLSTLGLDNIVIRDVVREPDRKGEILGTCWFLRLAGSLLVLVACNAAIALLRPEDRLTRALVAVVSLGGLCQTLDTIDLWFQSQLRAKLSVGARGVGYIVATFLKVGLILAGAGVVAFAIAGLLELALSAVALAGVYLATGERLTEWRFRWRTAVGLLRASWPLAISSLAIVTYMKIDQVMLGQMLGSEAVGVYAAATRISELCYFIPVGIVASVFAPLVEARTRDVEHYNRRMGQVFDGMALAAVGISVPLALLSPFVVRIFFGAPYEAAGPVLAIHTWASVFVFLGAAQAPWDAAEGLTHLAMRRTLIGAGAKIALNLALIPGFALQGAAAATLLSQACSGWLANALHPKTRGIFLQQARALLVFRHVRRLGRTGAAGPGGSIAPGGPQERP